MQPSFHLEGGKIVMKESGQYVTAIYFSQIGEIAGVAPTDIEDANAKLLTLVENFNGGEGTPQNLAQTLAIDNKTNDIPIVSNNGYSTINVNDDYLLLGYDGGGGSSNISFEDIQTTIVGLIATNIQAGTQIQLNAGEYIDITTPILNYNSEEVATQDWVTSQGYGTTETLAETLAIDNKTNDIPIVSNNGNGYAYVNDDYVSLTYGSQSFAMTDDYVSLTYGSQSFAMTEDGVQLYSDVPVTFDSNVSTDFNTPVLNYNSEEVATKNWVTSQGESISTAKIINRCPDDAFRNAHGNLKIGTVQYYGTRTSPSDLLRFPDLNDLSVFQKITLPSSGLGTIEYLNYNETLGKIYACLSTNKLLVINDIDDISDYDIIDLTLSQGSVNSSSVITTDDTHIYIGTRTSPNSYFIKLDATDYSEVLNEQWTGKADIHSFDWNYDKSELYFVIEGVNGYLAIINPIDLSFTEYLAGSNVTDDIAYILDANSPLSFDSWLFLPSEFRSLGDKGHSLFNLTTKVRYELDGLPSNGCKWDSDNFILYSACTNGFVEVWTGANLIASVFGAINPKSASTVYVNKEGLWLNEITKIDDRFFATAWNNEVENGGDGLGSLMELDLVNVNNGALSKKEEVIRNTFYINKEVSQALTSATSVDITFGEGYTWNLIASKKFGVNISPEDSFTAISLDKYYISNKTEVSFRINFNAPVTGTLNFTATIFPNY